MILSRRAGASLTTLTLALVLAGCASAPRGPVELNVVAINDFHGNLEPSRYNFTGLDGKTERLQAGGIDVLGGALATFRKEDKELLFVAAGDLVGASPALSSLWADEPAIEALNMMGLDASALGNHEFDAGRRELLRQQHGGCDSPRPAKACQFAPNFGGAKFSYLAANVKDAVTGKLLVPGWRIKEVKGVKVGLVGAVLQDVPSVAIGSAIAGLQFVDEAKAINDAVAQMRAQGATVFVALVHEGGFAKEPPQQQGCSTLNGGIVDIVKKLDPAIRVVITGHSHTGYLCKVDGRVVTQAGSAGHLATRIKLKVDAASGKVEDIDARNVVIKAGDFAPEPKLANYLAAVKERSREALARPVAKLGTAAVLRKQSDAGESALGDLIADAVLAATRDQGAQIGFMNPGGIRKDLEAGGDLAVSFGQAQAVLPFGNSLVVMDMTGEQLRTVLEQQWARPGASDPSVLQVSSGFTYRWDEKQPKGSRVVPGSMKLNGVPVEAGKTYRVVANNFLAEGGDNFPVFAKATNKVDTGMRDLDALIDYLVRNPGLGGPNSSLAPAPRIIKQ